MIVLRGDGIAVLTCGYLLQGAGFEVSIDRAPRTYFSALMLSVSSQALFRHVLGLRDAFSSLPRIQKRVVKWGQGYAVTTVPICQMLGCPMSDIKFNCQMPP